MMQLPIFLYGQQVLRKETEEISPEYPNISELLENMYETLVKADGVGLAAPQVGFSIRVFILDLTPLGEDDPEFLGYKKTFINPKIVEFSEESCTMEEGCLSLPFIHENVIRSTKIRIRYQDEHFVQHEDEFEGFVARVIQHEYDHLEGKVFTDLISPIRKQLIKSKLTSILKGKTKPAYKAR